jgi:hypothetical protein
MGTAKALIRYRFGDACAQVGGKTLAIVDESIVGEAIFNDLIAIDTLATVQNGPTCEKKLAMPFEAPRRVILSLLPLVMPMNMAELNFSSLSSQAGSQK